MLDVLFKKIPIQSNEGFSLEGLRSQAEQYLFSKDNDCNIKFIKSSGRFHLIQIRKKDKNFLEQIKRISYYTPLPSLARVITRKIKATNQKNAIIYYDNPKKTTSIFLEYINKGRLEEAKGVYALKNEVLEERDSEGKTPFELACEKGDVKRIKFLSSLNKEKIFSVNHKLIKTTFMEACKSGRLDIVKCLYALFGKALLKEQDNLGKTPFMIACLASKKEIAQWLYVVSKGEASQEKDFVGRSAFIYFYENSHKDALEYLYKLSHGQAIHDKDDLGRTAFMRAVLKEDISKLKELCRLGGKNLLKDRDLCGKTAFILACERNLTEIINILYEFGGKSVLKEEDIKGNTPFMLASRRGNIALVKYLNTISEGRLLEGKEGVSAFTQACLFDHIEVVRFFCERTGGRIFKENKNRIVCLGPQVSQYLNATYPSENTYNRSSDTNNNPMDLKKAVQVILGLGVNLTSKRQVRKAYHELILQHHPDKNKREGAKEKTQEINEAYSCITNSSQWNSLPN